MKLFQIEEPQGGPVDPDLPGAAIGIDAGGGQVEVAFSVGGNAEILADHEGFERRLPPPGNTAPQSQWEELFEAARVRAERALSRPVTHAVIVLAETIERQTADRLRQAAERVGLDVLRVAARAELPVGASAAVAAAMLAEDLAPHPG